MHWILCKTNVSKISIKQITSWNRALNAARKTIRKYVEYLDIDRPLFSDHNAMKELVKSCEILNEVEKTVGNLE